ncbi:hypothetical protein SAMN04487770_13636 [Butyrivibrio sp. ob235]|uniref:hypothetical protein n=1 Tax=Butyrivibrio sp. ob235 TaxID=1761780 RepID=UPI0008D5CB69|nr:hypothetical protein [Butyrivibrio sp. ob235]SEM38924.1 hypothetical protein SAMN04487770_13636 [Butyrivibrio sp. ob235]
MITLDEAYDRFVSETKYPLIYISESGNYCISEDLRNPYFYLLDKTTQEILKSESPIDFFEIFIESKKVYYEKLYDTLFEYCRSNSEREQELSQIYSVIWDLLYRSKEKDFQNEYENAEIQAKITSRLEELERILYDKIIEFQKNGKYTYPPCVLNRKDNHFYSIKPFMMKYGYTDNSSDCTWVRL